MPTDWSTRPEYTFAEQDLWKAKQSGNLEDPFDFKGVAEAPENVLLDPDDYDIFPEEVQVDNESWVTQDLFPAANQGWTNIEDGTS